MTAIIAFSALSLVVFLGLWRGAQRTRHQDLIRGILFGAFAAASYFFWVWRYQAWVMGSVYPGLVSDASYAIAYVNNVIHGNYFGDFHHKNLPTHYPPLLFWVSGTIGRFLGLSAVHTWLLVPGALFFLIPIILVGCWSAFGHGLAAVTLLVLAPAEIRWVGRGVSLYEI